MREVHFPFRKSLFELLSGKLALNGKTLTIWDVVPKEEENPYVVFLLQQTTLDRQRSGRHCKYYTTLIQLEIITAYYGQMGGKKDCDTLADQIYQLLPNWVAPAMEGYDWGMLELVNDFDRGQQIDTVRVVNSRLIEIETFFMVSTLR